MQVVGKLFDGPLDIVGDIHGEAEALEALLGQLGYDEQGNHAEDRRLVFVGDLVDRGPDSPAVVEKVMSLVERNVAQCILGNHELNILLGKQKHGNEWFLTPDANSEWHGKTVDESRQSDYLQFFSRLPLTLERDDLRIVHACWHHESIEKLQSAATNGKSLQATFGEFESAIRAALIRNGTRAAYDQEKQQYGHQIEYKYRNPVEHWPNPKMLDAHAAVGEAEQMGNPIKVLTSGVERKAEAPFPASGKFRFVERVKWWNEYADFKPVIVGHYWRKYHESQTTILADAPPDLFDGIEPDQWMGLNHNVYCVDFSVGLAAHNRAKNLPTDGCRLAAVRWPEQFVVFDDGQTKQLVRRWSQEAYRKAWNFASDAHAGQIVPGKTYSYLNHLGAVTMEVIACLEGDRSFAYPDLAVQCALLHDSMEDAGIPYERLESEFGQAVADGVRALSKNPRLASKRERMLDSLARIKHQPKEVWVVKLADRITNLQPPPDHWDETKIANYRDEAELIVQELGEASEYLRARLVYCIGRYASYRAAP